MRSQSHHYFVFLFLLLKFFALPILSLDSPIDLVEPINPQISDILVPYDDCSVEPNLLQFRLNRVRPCAQAPSAVEVFDL